MNLFRYVRWLYSCSGGPRSKRLTLQVTYSALCSLVPPLFIHFVISLQKQIINNDGIVTKTDLKTLVFATLFALVLLISRALVIRSTDDELSHRRTKCFKSMLERYLLSHRAQSSTSSEIELDLEILDRASNLLGRQAYLVRGAVATMIIFVPLAFFIQGPITLVSMAFGLITLIRLSQLDQDIHHRALGQQWQDNIQFQIKRQEWITHLPTITGLVRDANKLLARLSNRIKWSQQKTSIDRDLLVGELSSLAQFERISLITFTALAIVVGNFDRSAFLLIILLAGRFTQPLREIGDIWLSRSRALNGIKILTELTPVETKNHAFQIRKPTALIGATVLDNLTLGEKNLECRAMALAEQTKLGRWIEDLPSGYLTTLQEDSPFVPQNIRQLIASIRIITIANGSPIILNGEDGLLEPETIEDLMSISDPVSSQSIICVMEPSHGSLNARSQP